MEEFTEENSELEDGVLFEHYRLTVDQGQSAIRIDKFLANRIDNTSRSPFRQQPMPGTFL